MDHEKTNNVHNEVLVDETSQQRPQKFVGRRTAQQVLAAREARRCGKCPKGNEIVHRPQPISRKNAYMSNQVPDSISKDPELIHAMSQLPSNYNFQVEKTVWRLKRAGARRVALQLPEGLLLFACILADIFEQIAGVEHAIVMADVTYGACCVDDYSARALGCDFLIHYGHSCLVPIDVTGIKDELGGPLQVMYVFVDIDIDFKHLVECIKISFPDQYNTRIALMGTIQFAAALHKAKGEIDSYYSKESIVPQAKPLSKGEVLGCTSPSIKDYIAELSDKVNLKKDGSITALVFVADGRFHLESAMIANPDIPAYRYNPYDKRFSREAYDITLMKSTRLSEINRAKSAQRWGVVLGTLGRQGNSSILARIETLLRKRSCDYIVLLLSEMFPAKLALLDKSIDSWIQIACPRLSIDWGTAFSKPLLTPYEAYVALGETQWREVYPQDYYSKDGGQWGSFYKKD